MILLLCGILIGIGMIFIVNPISQSKWYIGINGHITVIALSYLMYAIIDIFNFPVLFKIGYTKSRFWGLVLPVALNAIFLGIYFSVATAGGMAVLATVLLIIPYLISVKVYSKRDF